MCSPFPRARMGSISVQLLNHAPLGNWPEQPLGVEPAKCRAGPRTPFERSLAADASRGHG